MAWTDGNLASALTELEAAEHRLEAGESSRDLKQAAPAAAYNSAYVNENPAQAEWRREILERAQHVIDACLKQ